jgi:glutaredoxin
MIFVSDIPELLAEWHPIKNDGVNPFMVKAKQSRKKYWWFKKECGHEWQTEAINRFPGGKKCAVCNGNILIPEVNSLQAKYPEKAKLWHPTKNNTTPDKIGYRSNKKVNWICSKGHEWDTTVDATTLQNKGCPYCGDNDTGRKSRVCLDNCLATTHPEIAKEWHKEKNGSLTPYDVIAGSHSKAWWQCPKYENHVWDAVIKNRTINLSGCRFCNPSKNQDFLYNIIKRLYPKENIEYNIKYEFLKFSNGRKMELDIYLPEIKIAFEYQGEYHFLNEIKHIFRNRSSSWCERYYEKITTRDEEKRIACNNNGIILIEIDYKWKKTEEFVIGKIKEKTDYPIG